MGVAGAGFVARLGCRHSCFRDRTASGPQGGGGRDLRLPASILVVAVNPAGFYTGLKGSQGGSDFPRAAAGGIFEGSSVVRIVERKRRPEKLCPASSTHDGAAPARWLGARRPAFSAIRPEGDTGPAICW